MMRVYILAGNEANAACRSLSVLGACTVKTQNLGPNTTQTQNKAHEPIPFLGGQTHSIEAPVHHIVHLAVYV